MNYHSYNKAELCSGINKAKTSNNKNIYAPSGECEYSYSDKILSHPPATGDGMNVSQTVRKQFDTQSDVSFVWHDRCDVDIALSDERPVSHHIRTISESF